MTGIQFLEVLAAAVAAGAFGAMLGLGGGIILVPALIAVLDVPRTSAVAASLVSIVATSASASLTYLKDRCVDLRVAAPLEFATSVGALCGAAVAWGFAHYASDERAIADAVFACCFAALLVYSAWSIARPRTVRLMQKHEVTSEPTEHEGAYPDPATGQTISYRVRKKRDGLIAGFFAGNVSALLGVGGGLIMVPVMTARMGLPLKVAVGTSSLVIGSTAAATSIPYLSAGWVQPYYAVTCTLGVLAGGRIGARLAQRMKTGKLRLVFAAVLLYTAYTMALRAAALWNR